MPRSLPVLLIVTGCVPHLHGGGDSEAAWSLPKNEWPSCGTPDADFADEETGYDVGDLMPDMRLMDQNGETVSLWQFTGCVTILDISPMWCAPCQTLARGVDALYAEHSDDGFRYVTLLSEDEQSNPTDLSDLERWSDNFKVKVTPIVADTGYTAAIATDNQFPRVLGIGRDMRVVNANMGTQSSVIEPALDKILAEQ